VSVSTAVTSAPARCPFGGTPVDDDPAPRSGDPTATSSTATPAYRPGGNGATVVPGVR
jgi:hypothetical protein